MKKQKQYYLIRLQFLGYRFSGWQKQPGYKTIEGMLAKTLKFILPERQYKILGAGRTDAKVSALDAAFELFLDGEPLEDLDFFLSDFNKNLPSDIRIVDVKHVKEKFNIIQHSKEKEYVYLFSFGEKNHPYAAPFMANIQAELDLDLMKKATSLFVGTHNFKSFTAKPKENGKFIRKVNSAEIKENTILKANFFPEKSYAFHIKGEGFMRYQVRMLMGALIQLGKGEVTLSDIEEALKLDSTTKFVFVAPGSGLMLHSLDFKDDA
ncbi:tRNA pseudouridine38-40 synthase [Cellulophaga sp. RHA19]|uniref:tRNA pseudouridine(38-40) synthase TruA n=1 Tax=Cellulophaga sp. RHA19 TaxID=1798237 RepID=UPI000CB820B2|nr:tRNA pseudouridine(38-40) synthase TruA [Cellulophaga sp. RHA19]PKB44293.1 tRNA pseudouridine38-40 synthase [Cellulophaga sp. RHA19]